jgi:hypothetical protein
MVDLSEGHWECLVATDFMSVEVLTLKGLITQHVQFFINMASRSVHIVGITHHPDSSWVTQIARNITDVSNGLFCRKRYLILDRDTEYSDAFCRIPAHEGIEVIRARAGALTGRRRATYLQSSRRGTGIEQLIVTARYPSIAAGLERISCC